MAVLVKKSTDSNAPVLTGAVGSLLNLLDAILVTGYGAVRATGTITSSGTNVSNNDTVTVDGVTYTFKTTLTPAANEVLIGANAAASLSNLAAAMGDKGTRGTNYATGTTQQTNTQVTGLSSTVITIEAFVGGTAGNSIAMSKSAATLTLSGATLSGGSGTNSGGAGWTKPYTGTNKAVFRGAAGVRAYLNVQDNAPGAGLSKEARVWGYLAATAQDTGTDQFPTAAQQSSGIIWRKSASADSTARVWKAFVNDRTLHLFIASGDAANNYFWYCFGDIYSYLTGDSYHSFIMGRQTSAENTATDTAGTSSTTGTGCNNYQNHNNKMWTAMGGHYMCRGYTGLGGSVQVGKHGNASWLALNSGQQEAFRGEIAYPNPVDGGLYISPIYIMDPTTAPVQNLRGEIPGAFHQGHAISNFADGDTFSGATATDYAGRTFEIVKGIGNNTGVMVIETTDWATSV